MFFNRTIGFAVVVLGLALPSPAQVVINEVCADNGSLVSAAGTLPDYVELHNTGTSAVALAGWTLTDDVTKPTKWAFPSDATIAVRSNLVIWLDTTNNYPGLIATNFSLRSSGEEVGLFQVSTQRDYIRFGPQIQNRTICRYPSGGANWTLGLQTPGTTNISVALGTPLALRINEIMATNSLGDDWLELFNPSTNLPVAIGNLVFADTNDLSGLPALWPNGFIKSDGFILFSCTGETNRGDRLNFKLSSTLGETISLYASNRTTLIDMVTFGPQQSGVSCGRLPDGGTNFFYFTPTNYVSPAEPNDWQSLNTVAVNEVLTHTDLPMEDAVELLNLTDQPVDISFWWISNSRNLPLKFRIPAGTVLPARGYKVFFEQKGSSTPGFNRSGTGVFPDFTFNSAHGDEVVITVGTSALAVTGQRNVRDLPAGANGVALARHVKSSGGTDFVPESRRTFGNDTPATLASFRLGTGLSNAYPLVGPIIFSEIMYHPPDVISGDVIIDNSLDEYIELKNITNAPVKLYDPAYPTNTWQIKGGIGFRFPTNVTIAATSAVLLVNFDPGTNLTQLAAFRSKYGLPANIPLFGPYSGKLNNKTESLELYKPDPVQLAPHPDAGFVPSILVEKLNYEDSDPWPAGADNTGQALQRISHTGYANDNTNWFAGPATPGDPNIPSIPPIIIAQPRDAVVMPGDDVVFNVTTIGTPVLTYQWYWSGLELPGADSSTFWISGAESFYEGGYHVIINNAAGTAMSAIANLSVLTPPVIIDEPVSQVVMQGTSTILDVIASGTEPLSYQWFFETNVVAGATGPVLVIPNTQPTHAGNYHVIITNVAGVDISTPVTVTVFTPPVILVEPISQVVTQGISVVLDVTASGTEPLSYKWFFGTNVAAGATGPVLVIPNTQLANAGSYHVLVTNLAGVDTSTTAILTVLAPPVILVEPISQVVTQGTSTMLDVIASGTEPLSYQWFFETNVLAGATGPVLVIPNTQPTHAGNYHVIITNVAGVDISTPVTVTVFTPPVILVEPISQVVMQGISVVLDVTASGTEPLSYKWFFGTNVAAGATGPVLVIPNAQPTNAGSYHVLVTNLAGVDTSTTAILTVLAPPVILVEPVSQVVTQGTSAVLAIAASGTEPLSYKWFFGTNVVAGATGPVLVIPNAQLTNAGSYHVLITNLAGVDTSTTVTVTVGLPPTINTQPVSQFVAVGTNVTLAVSGTGTAPMSYQWRKDGTNFPGANSSMLVLNSVQTNQTGLYDVVLANSFGVQTSAVAVVSIAGPPYLVSVTRLTNGFTEIVLDGLSGHIYELLGSTNFNGWTVITRLTNTSGRQLFLDTSATNQPFRFYRGELVP